MGVPARKYVWDGWIKITLYSIPFAIATALVEKHWFAKSLPLFLLQILAVLPVYAICVGLFFRDETLNMLRRWQASKLDRPQTAT